MDLLDLLDRPIAYHPSLARAVGSVPAGIMLGQAIYWQRRCPLGRDGWWWHTADEWAEETALGRYEIEGGRRRLRELGLIEERREGLPARTWYRVDLGALTAFLSKKHNDIHGLLETSKQESGKPANKSRENQQDPRTTPRTTAETTTTTTSSASARERIKTGGGDSAGKPPNPEALARIRRYIELATAPARIPSGTRDPEAYGISIERRLLQLGDLGLRETHQMDRWAAEEQRAAEAARKNHQEDLAAARQAEAKAAAEQIHQEALATFDLMPRTDQEEILQTLISLRPILKDRDPGSPLVRSCLASILVGRPSPEVAQ